MWERSFYSDLGSAIRLARIMSGKTQGELADRIGTSQQQLQNYEYGINRIPLEQLLRLAADLGVPLSRLLSPPEGDAELSALVKDFQGREFHALLESWAHIKRPSVRAAILYVVESLAALEKILTGTESCAGSASADPSSGSSVES